MNDFLLALTVTVLSSTAGLAVSSVVPASDWWHDPRLLGPLVTCGVNAIWLLYRIWRRRRHRQTLLDDRAAQWAQQEAEYVLRIQKLEQAQSESVALIRILRRQTEDLRAELAQQDQPFQ